MLASDLGLGKRDLGGVGPAPPVQSAPWLPGASCSQQSSVCTPQPSMDSDACALLGFTFWLVASSHQLPDGTYSPRMGIYSKGETPV